VQQELKVLAARQWPGLKWTRPKRKYAVTC